MLQRIITGAVLSVLVIGLIVFSSTFVFPVIMTLLTLVGTYEMLGCIGLKKNMLVSIPALIASLLGVLSAYFLGYGACLAVIMCYLLIQLALCVFLDEKVKVQDAFCAFSSTLYVMLCLSAFTAVRMVEDTGLYFFLLVFIGAWMTDTFAYFTGVFFGKHKLIPKISPKKTIEGSIGGIVFCIVAFAVYGLILEKAVGVNVNFPVLLVLGLVMSVISQIGDLIASAIKRTYGIKDYGNLFPGHGGVLDRFDSIMILSPIVLLAAENLLIFA